MPIPLHTLRQQLVALSAAQAPGRDFCQSIAELARTGRLARLRAVLPPVVYEELRQRYRQNPAAFIAGWHQLALEMQHGFVQHARQRLTSLTRLQPAARATPAWQQIQHALDAQQNDLLRTAFAFELLDLVEPAAARAAHLRECVVAAPASEEADRYLDEATRCYFYGLFTACAGLCRSVLEESIRQKLPPQLARLIRSRYRNAPTLGNLLHEVNNNLQLTGFHPGFPAVANKVNDTAKKAVHQSLITEPQARTCLHHARQALELLLQP